jgi:arsenate reductase
MQGETVIYHNPKCGTSRKVLGMLRDAGLEPVVVEYLKAPPTRDELIALLAQLELPVREILRRKEAGYTQLGLDDATKPDGSVIDAILAHPVLMQRPIVISPRGARICRPAEAVRALLP